MMTSNRTPLAGNSFSSLIFIALSVTGCGTPQASQDESRQPTESIEVHPYDCPDGTHAGCEPCTPNPASPAGGYRTCWTCDGAQHTQVCEAPASFNATWTATARVWNDSGAIATQEKVVTIPVTFAQQSDGWYMYVKNFSQKFGKANVSLQSGKYGHGKIDTATGGATLELPMHVEVDITGISPFNVTLDVGTDKTISPPDGGPRSGRRHDTSSNLATVGSGTSDPVLGRGITFWLELSGSISNWPVFASSFESGIGDWTTWANCATDNTWYAINYYTASDNPAPKGGKYALRLHTSGFRSSCAYPGVYALSPSVRAFGGVTYRVSDWVRNSSGNSGSTVILFYDTAGNELAEQSVGWASDPWQYNPDPDLTVTAPPGTASLRIRYGLTTQNTYGDVDLLTVDSKWPVFATSFEDGIDGWTTWANCATDSTWYAIKYNTASDNPAPQGGANALRLHSSGFQPGCEFPGVYALSPSVPAVAGMTYQVSDWIRNSTGGSGSTVILFFDSAGNQLAQQSVDWASDPWQYNPDPVLTAIAPEGTASLRIRYGLTTQNTYGDVDLLTVD